MVPAAAEDRPYVFFETIGKKDGLPPNMHKIRQDSSGYIWLLGESGQGAFKFDGAKFAPVGRDTAGLRQLPARTVYAILPLPNGDVWVGSDLGVFYFEAATGYFLPKPCGITEEFLSILRDRTGNIWAGSKEGLMKYDEIKDSLMPFPKGVLNAYTGEFLPQTYFDAFPQLFEHPNGKIWSVALLYQKTPPNLPAVVEIDPDRNTLRFFPLPALFDGAVFDLGNWNHLDLINHCIWIPYETVLLKFSLTDYSFEQISLTGLNGRTPFLTQVKTAGRDRIWVASSDGLFLFDLAAGQYHDYQAPGNMARSAQNGNRCRDILMASDGTLWSLYEDYLAKIDPKR